MLRPASYFRARARAACTKCLAAGRVSVVMLFILSACPADGKLHESQRGSQTFLSLARSSERFLDAEMSDNEGLMI